MASTLAWTAARSESSTISRQSMPSSVKNWETLRCRVSRWCTGWIKQDYLWCLRHPGCDLCKSRHHPATLFCVLPERNTLYHLTIWCVRPFGTSIFHAKQGQRLLQSPERWAKRGHPFPVFVSRWRQEINSFHMMHLFENHAGLVRSDYVPVGGTSNGGQGRALGTFWRCMLVKLGGNFPTRQGALSYS